MTSYEFDKLVEIKEKIKEDLDYIKWKLRDEGIVYERAKYWISSIECALDKEHSWLGGCMFTMEDTLNALEDDVEREEDEEEIGED